MTKGYVVITGDIEYKEDFENDVESHLKDGWVLAGGVSMTSLIIGDEINDLLAQAMTLDMGK